MSSRTPRRPVGRGRLTVTVTHPDGAAVSTRGLAAWLEKAAPAEARGEVTVALVSDGRMRTLNRAFRGKDAPTDVLSFPAATAKRPQGASSDHYLGDIVIATGIATRQAKEIGHPLGTELRVLALHGLLHLLGFDHETDSGEMAHAEEKLRKKAGLKQGLIGR
jgi:probable rRNA maturation factor